METEPRLVDPERPLCIRLGPAQRTVTPEGKIVSGGGMAPCMMHGAENPVWLAGWLAGVEGRTRMSDAGREQHYMLRAKTIFRTE